MSDLQVLFPGEEITVGGETITIKPFTFGQLPQVLKLSRPIMGAVASVFAKQDKMDETTAMLFVLSEGGENLIDLIALSAKKPREWFEELNSADGIRLLALFLEVNISFFVQSVLPTFKDVMEHLKTKVDGQVPSVT